MDKDDYRLLAEMLARHVDGLQAVSAAWGRDVMEAYEETERDILLLVDRIYQDFGKFALDASTMRKLRQIQAMITEMRAGGLTYAMEYIGGALSNLVKNEVSFGELWLVAMLSLNLGLDVESVRRTTNIKTLTQEQSSSVRKYGVYSGNTVDDIFRKISEADATRIYSSVSKGLSGRVKPDVVRYELIKAMATTRRQIEVNVALIVNGVANDVSVSMARKNTAIVDEVMWVTEMDDRVCSDCDALEGMTFSPDDAPSCPMHPNCRCYLVPVTKNISIDIKDLRNA